MMTRRSATRLLGGSLFGLKAARAAMPERPPNFVIFYADDLGYGDLGCYGNRVIRTPNIDRLAEEGTKFTEFYATPTCSPSRAALLTGRYPIRTGVTRVLIPKEQFGLPDSEITIAAALGRVGYRTACIGKWHLGDRPRYRPDRHGFDNFYGILYSHDMRLPVVHLPTLRLFRGARPAESAVPLNRMTAKLTEGARRFIESSGENPFFLYMPYHLPHVPWKPAPEFKAKSSYGPYGDVVEEMDSSVGEIMRTLRERGLDENTLVMFISDNGPELNTQVPGGNAGPLRGGKATAWEGGVRVPCLARWPGRIPAGKTRAGIGSVMDLFPTLVGLAGGEAPEDREIDGLDLTAFLEGKSDSPRQELLHYRGGRLFAVRSGSWKLHFIKREQAKGGGLKSSKRANPPELYNLVHDPGERTNLAAAHPEVVARLTKVARRMQESIVPGKLPPPRWRSVLP
jgi:arylsulfatase A